MTPLEAARQLAQDGIGMHCDACTGSPLSGHIYGCPMLQMPKIVAALEAAERVASTEGGIEPIVTVGVQEEQLYSFCDRVAYPDQGHALDCPWLALVAALKDTP